VTAEIKLHTATTSSDTISLTLRRFPVPLNHVKAGAYQDADAAESFWVILFNIVRQEEESHLSKIGFGN
jgi:hypothetical protein